LEAIIILAPQLKGSDTPFESEWAPPHFEKLPFLQNYRFWEITVLRNYRFFICTFILQKSLLEAIIILAPQLKWSDTPFDSEWAPPSFEKLPFLLNYRFWQITIFYLYIYTAEERVGGNNYFTTATEMMGYPIRERMGTILFWEITVFAKLPFLRYCRFWQITVFDKLSIFFICTFILQKSLLEAVIILAPQLKWSDTPFESEWAPPYFEKLPFL